jgi:uncharacterized protein YyaL (SSP411 family)
MPSNLFINHLQGEKSPYLLQHVHNPVDWYPWGKAAFEKAKRENKPVLLSIGYSTCHWCHVMAHESFEDQGIAKIINDHFIAIKVDREERPDIDHIYMTFTTAMTGQGGWPLTAFLTPDGEPFYGGTYFPPYAKWGSVGFIDLLESIAKGWVMDRKNILESSHSITEQLRQRAAAGEAAQPFNQEKTELLLDQAFRQMRGQFDAQNGGFGTAPKFPMGHNLSFLLRYYKRTRDAEALKMVEQTLTSMAHGGIWDHLGGGFHRYSTDPNWHVPHFEKMLYDQALLSRAYLEAYQATGSWAYEQVARSILDYVLRDMTDAKGGFYSAEDADSADAQGHSKEGAFYVFSKLEIAEALGLQDAEVFDQHYGVLPQGNASFDPHGEFTGKNILYLAQDIQDEATREIIGRAKEKLFELRSQRPRPHKDDKILCDWNGLMMASFAFAGRVLGEPRYSAAAAKAADFVMTEMMSGSRLLHRWREGEAGITATLEDYAFLMYGLLEVYEATFQDKYLEAAEAIADGMISFFSDQNGGFYMTASDAEELILRPKEIYDGALPSGNSVAALSLLKLYALTQKEEYQSQAEALFGFFFSSAAQAPHAHCFLLSAMDWHLQGAVEVTFEGPVNDPMIAKMLKVLYKHFVPLKAVKFSPASGKLRALICQRGACQAPIENVDAFERAWNNLFQV